MLAHSEHMEAFILLKRMLCTDYSHSYTAWTCFHNRAQQNIRDWG